MPPSDIATADIQSLLDKLSREELISLLAGVGFWHTHAVPRLGIPAIKVSDGPNGVRGGHFFMGTPAKCLPCATALGSTWDRELIQEAGGLLAAEAKLRAASVILAPTTNIQRSPLGGRSFESFSEDPHLSGHIASAYINGVQNEGICACIKHFVANDQEDDRMAVDSIVGARALREIYLMPFMLAQKYANPSAYMTAYNRLNGTHCSEHAALLQDILRKEWGYDGLIMSDWFGVYSVSESINAGVDLEMPGINKWRTVDHVMRSIDARKIMLRTVRERAARVLGLVQKCAIGAPEILDGDGAERTRDSEEDDALMRRVAAESIVLLKNDAGLLPLSAGDIRKIAVVGPNAKARVISGGGSAALKPSYVTTPYQGIVNALPAGVEVLYAEGATAHQTLPSLDHEIMTPDGGAPGWIMDWHGVAADGYTILPAVIKSELVDETSIFLSDAQLPAGLLAGERWALRLRGTLRPRASRVRFEFGLSVAGRARLFVDGGLVVDSWTAQAAGGRAFFGLGSAEATGAVELGAGERPAILVEFLNVVGLRGGATDGQVAAQAGVRLGGREVLDGDRAMDDAVACARAADVAVVVVGLNSEWEAEGYDRATLDLPGRTDELVEKVAAANPRTVVVTQSGSAITMPWIRSAGAVVHAWYLGNATGDAIADVLFGRVNPSGKLSLTFPRRLEDTPAFGHYGSENGKVLYAEDLFVGYKHYLHRKITPLFPFGFGLSYTTFGYSDLVLSKPTGSGADDFRVTAAVQITNTGRVAGSEVVQLYISPPATSALTHPPRALKGFAKARRIEPGKCAEVRFALDKYAVSYWEERRRRWVAEEGVYTVCVGSSSADIKAEDSFVISREFEWAGL